MYVFQVEREGINQNFNSLKKLYGPSDEKLFKILGDVSCERKEALKSLFEERVAEDDFESEKFAKECVKCAINTWDVSTIGGEVRSFSF